jgi:hypothetical protein
MEYFWQEDFIHHIESHNVVPPSKFILHVLENDKSIVGKVPFKDKTCLEESNYEIVFSNYWWNTQIGNKTSYIDSINNIYSFTFYTFSVKKEKIINLLEKYSVPYTKKKEDDYSLSIEINMPYLFDDKIKKMIENLKEIKLDFIFSKK